MTADELAVLHGRCFTVPRPFSAEEFTGFLADPTCFLITRRHGFLLGRVVADEAELLTVAVDPDQRRAGLGHALVAAFHDTARDRGARQAVLEVAEGNRAARALYAAAGYTEAGRRRGYYRHPDGRREDALVLARALAGN